MHSVTSHHHPLKVGMGCLANKPNPNCSWISGDAIFVTRTRHYTATNPGSLNDPANWEFHCTVRVFTMDYVVLGLASSGRGCCTVRVFGLNVALEDAIEHHVFAPLEALAGV
jgi:hypothetical protein